MGTECAVTGNNHIYIVFILVRSCAKYSDYATKFIQTQLSHNSTPNTVCVTSHKLDLSKILVQADFVLPELPQNDIYLCVCVRVYNLHYFTAKKKESFA